MQLQSNYTFCAQAITKPHITLSVTLIECFQFYLNNNNLITYCINIKFSNVLLVNEHQSGWNILPPMLKILSIVLAIFESVMHGRIFIKRTSITFLITQLQTSITITIAIT